ncbi:MAG: hypothetical protein HQM13_23805 [SAR324 cluster bacterium]|nr:hypothetical protein [SAR324 cluster bacterium]
MNFAKEIGFKKVNALQSGRFFRVHVVSRCYRINEVDHFLKDLTNEMLIFLDNQGACHHFNRLESKASAITSLKELLAVPNLKEIEFFEVSQESIDAAGKGKDAESEESETMLMLRKIVSSFSDKQTSERGEQFSLEELKSSYMKDYIRPVELRN